MKPTTVAGNALVLFLVYIFINLFLINSFIIYVARNIMINRTFVFLIVSLYMNTHTYANVSLDLADGGIMSILRQPFLTRARMWLPGDTG